MRVKKLSKIKLFIIWNKKFEAFLNVLFNLISYESAFSLKNK